MSRNVTDRQIAELARAARVAGRNNPGLRRTAYLNPTQLRQASLPRLVTEIARAEHPGADPGWRDRRRGQLADELERREFPAAAGIVNESWGQARYAETQADIARDNADVARSPAEVAAADAAAARDDARIAQEQRRVETEEIGGPSPVGLGAGTVGVVGLALAADELTEQEADVAYQSGEVALIEQFSADGTDPTVVGEAMAPTEATDVAADVADSVAAAPAVSVATEPAVATVEQEVKTGPEL